MTSAILLATALTLATPTGQPKISFDCAAFRKQPDGAWTVVKRTLVVIENFERRTLDETMVEEGAHLSPDSKPAPPVKDDFVSVLTAEMWKDVDLVGELNKRCR